MAEFLSELCPIPEKYQTKVKQLIEAGENVTVVTLPAMGLTGFASKLNSENAKLSKPISKKTDKHLPKIIYLPVDLNQEWELMETQLEFTLNSLSKEKGLYRQIYDLLSRDYSFAFILDNIEVANLEKLKKVLGLRTLNQGLMKYVLLIRHRNLINLESNSSAVGMLFHNTIYIPYLNKKEALEWSKYICKSLKIDLNNKDMQDLLEFAGGIPGLLKNSLRAINNSGNLDSALKSEQLQKYVENLWSRFSTKEQYVLKNLLITKKLVNLPEAVYLKSHQLITADNLIYGSWVERLLSKHAKLQIKIREKQILIEGIHLEDIFSEKENKVILALCATKSRSLSRDQVAKLIWTDASQYSDWAIDKFFSRMRQKLKAAGINTEFISTLKKAGYKLNNVSVI